LVTKGGKTKQKEKGNGEKRGVDREKKTLAEVRRGESD